MGYWYIIYLNDNNQGWIISTKSSFENLTKNNTNQINILNDEKKESDLESDPIIILERNGDYCNTWYRKREINFIPITPTEIQQNIINEITSFYEKNNRNVSFISGLPNKGKSIIGLLLAMQFKGIYCNTFKPWQPGDILGDVYIDAEPTKEKPLIIILDEIDIALNNIHNGISPHKKIPISVSDKQGWNGFLDQINWGMYPYMIMLLISNKSFQFIDSLDNSYLREGRVNLKFEM
jgi:hypothetical protein